MWVGGGGGGGGGESSEPPDPTLDLPLDKKKYSRGFWLPAWGENLQIHLVWPYLRYVYQIFNS